MSKSALVHLTLDMAGQEYTAQGKTVHEALEKLPLEWQQVKAKCIVKLKQGKMTYEHLFFGKVFRRILVNKITRQIWAKRLEFFLASDREHSLGNVVNRTEPE